jgi:hypothetical protein
MLAMFCSQCGGEILIENPAFCPRCGAKLNIARAESTGDGLSFTNLDQPPRANPSPEARPRPRSLPPWNIEPIRCAPYTFGPHVHKFKFHGTYIAPEGKWNGDAALTLTGFQFISKGGGADILIYYETIVGAQKTSSSTFAITTDDGHTFEFKLAVPHAWVDKIQEMTYLR